jgi:hypothetical protein
MSWCVLRGSVVGDEGATSLSGSLSRKAALNWSMTVAVSFRLLLMGSSLLQASLDVVAPPGSKGALRSTNRF